MTRLRFILMTTLSCLGGCSFLFKECLEKMAERWLIRDGFWIQQHPDLIGKTIIGHHGNKLIQPFMFYSDFPCIDYLRRLRNFKLIGGTDDDVRRLSTAKGTDRMPYVQKV